MLRNPISLFYTFYRASIKADTVIFPVTFFVVTAGGIFAGRLLCKLVKEKDVYFPFTLTGYEAGMLGYALFGILLGNDKITQFALMDIGHVLAIFTVYVAMVKKCRWKPSDRQDEAPKDKIFEAECQVVRNLAKKGNCVIVGRCADYVLRNSGNCLKVFFSAPLMSRIRRVAQRQNISEGEAKATVQKNEKLRADNYRYYTRRMWGAAGNFDLSLNTDLGEEYIENCIRSAMKL